MVNHCFPVPRKSVIVLGLRIRPRKPLTRGMECRFFGFEGGVVGGWRDVRVGGWVGGTE